MSALLLALLNSIPGVINGSIPNGSGGGAGATFQLKNDGTYVITGNSNANWVTPAAAVVAAFYQVKVDNTGGAAFASGTLGTYEDLSSTRTWTIDPAGGTAVFTVTIREKATGIVRSTQTGKTLAA